ncbi:M48 family metallopeptidase [Gottfriedia luciferensis]|uniref:M48 family metallopeptidase n=1 Tax=Gottfriedia luciferensis TaxID=178774 RepID=UPI000B4552EA|nr:M48 family metallopeptidase [Gottfriedia luciferensis]
MKKSSKSKLTKIICLGYLIYIILVLLYFYVFTSSNLPLKYKGTFVDPHTFMNHKEANLSASYSTLKNVLYFISLPLDWIVLSLLLLSGTIERLGDSLSKLTRFKFIQVFLYFFFVSIITYIVTFPINFYRFKLSTKYGLSVQTFNGWMKDEMISFWINFAMMFFVMYVVYLLIKKQPKKWWLTAWLLSIPFTIFLTFIQPVVIDPLYNDFYPLKDKKLENKIVALAHEANIPASRVYEVNMSTKTTTYNAYVTGIGKNARIVLWDTTLKGLSEEEIMFIMAHEMSHYVNKDIYKSMFGILAGSLVGLYIISRLMNAALSKSRNKNASEKMAVILTLFLIISGIVGFISDPISNTFSRSAEKRADLFAVKLTKDPEAGITAFQKLSRNSLAQVNPPFLVKLFRYDHPTMLERMKYLEATERVNRKK